MWRELDDILKERFLHSLGGQIGVDAAAIDSGDGETMETVYRFAFPRFNRKIVAIKGVNGKRPPIEVSKQKTRGGRLFIVGVDGIKSSIFNRLQRGKSIRFSKDLDPVWFEQLTSERPVVRYTRGQPVRRFERVLGRDAEALDCMVYAVAVKNLLNINWEARREMLANGQKVTSAANDNRPRVIQSAWMAGG